MINYFIPVVVLFIIIYGIYKKVDIFDTFIDGVKEGMKICINLFPTIFALIISISLLVDSNFITCFSSIFNPIFSKINFPTEVLPLAILRPISGSSSLVILNSILSKYGADSFIGVLASVMQGSTDTTIYIVGMYFASIGVKKIRYSLLVGLLADILSVIISLLMVSMYFNGI